MASGFCKSKIVGKDQEKQTGNWEEARKVEEKLEEIGENEEKCGKMGVCHSQRPICLAVVIF